MFVFCELQTYTVLGYMLLPTALKRPPAMVALALARMVVGFMTDAISVCDGFGASEVEGACWVLLLGCCFCWSSSISYTILVDCPSSSSRPLFSRVKPRCANIGHSLLQVHSESYL
ncbi:hypothetical protein GYMLUDRAFT_954298 [Collybiopsis luxurians FD-317 M1]|nr:hypothetical protein GYMLUDRAFT_954298 [Collybiopsis luxurians FD-317 M1]